MIIKKFQGKTEEEAVKLAKAELGEGIVVMNVRNAEKKGFLGFFKKKQIEITVALEEENNGRSSQAKTEENTVRETFRQVTEVIKQKEAQEAKEAEKEENDEHSALEARLNSLQDMLEKQLQVPETDNYAEIQSNIGEKENGETNRLHTLIRSTLIENEIDEKYAEAILEEMERVQNSNLPLDQVLSGIYQKMILKFGDSVPITPGEKGMKLVFFIGPTGVGKTTTIAKIASKLCVEKKKRVALLTTDTYRIAAAEQLRTYANILEVPFRVIYTEDDMKNAVQEFEKYDYVLVDTAGHSHHNEEQKHDMRKFLEAVSDKYEKEVHMVLSATTKYKDLLSIADTYSEFTEYKLIFTKLDETVSLGNLLNLRLHTGAGISYVTCGQNVPDDIEEFNPQKTVKQLLGGKI